MSIVNVLWGYILPILITFVIFLLLDNNCEKEQPIKKGYLTLLLVASFLPAIGIGVAIFMLGYYIFGRCSGYIALKNNKFNQKWFGVNKTDKADE